MLLGEEMLVEGEEDDEAGAGADGEEAGREGGGGPGETGNALLQVVDGGGEGGGIGGGLP